MRNEIEKYIHDNRAQLDVDAPSDALWNKIEEELDDKKKIRGAIWWWSAAASVALIVVLFLELNYKNEASKQQLAQNEKGKDVFVPPTFTDTVKLNLKLEKVVSRKLNLKTEKAKEMLIADSKICTPTTFKLSAASADGIVNISSANASTNQFQTYSWTSGNGVAPATAGTYSIEKKDSKNATVFSGNLTLDDNNQLPHGAEIVVTDNETNEVLGVYKPNQKTGKYLFVLPPGKNYNITYEAEGYLMKTESLEVPQNAAFEQSNFEQYGQIVENEWKSPMQEPLSTFSVDVDAAGYSNVRRFLNNDQLPPKNAVKIEEMVNYFGYNYPKPTGADPLSITTEYGICPWNTKHKLVHIGLKAKDIEKQNVPASNLVFLIDVSGSMQAADKLELLKKGFTLLTSQLREQDRVSIVVYAGASGVVLPPTKGNDKATILAAIDRLSAGGSTAGAEGIELAYKVAAENYKKEGNNRVILATDGDFNVGISQDDDLVKLIEEKRKSGVFLTVLGFGEGNLQAEKMEKLADNGNGNYAYVDNLMEAKKVLVNEFGALYTVAKDVKLQVEFNPAKVKAYRLLGYENRMLRTEDFDNDTIDAGEMGAGHTVTALYEIIPADSDEKIFDTPRLRYQKVDSVQFSNNNELMYVKFRYKDPEGTQSKLLKHIVYDKQATLTENFYFSAAVAEFGLLIRESKFKGNASFENIEANAEKGYGADKDGYRHEFVMLIRKAKLLMKK